MKKFVRQYENPNVARFNDDLIEKRYDEPLVDYIVDCCKSLEALKYIKFVGYKYVTDASEIDISSYITAKSRNKPTSKKDKEIKYMHLKDSRFAELRMKFHLSCKGEECEINKKVLIPVPDKHGRYLIYGTEYFLMYQQVDNSTYTTKSSLVLKSMMPLSMKPDRETMTSTTGEEFTAPVYTINIFKNDTDIMLFYFAKIGVQKTLEYFSVDKVMKFVSRPEDTEKNIYFSVSSKLYLEVNRHFFEKYQFVKTIAFMCLRPMTNRMTVDVLENKGMWIESIGSIRNSNKNTQYEKGANTLLFFDRLLDDTTKRTLKLHGINDKNIYSVVRWLIMNFNELRKKDNLNLDNKRLRCNEYIASLVGRAFNERVNRIISLGNRVTLAHVKEIFAFPGDIIIQQLHRSGLLRFDDSVNDMTFFSKLRVTSKGPNAIGATNDNNISTKYRGIYPSFLGRIDINVCGTSDPGSTRTLTPFCNTSGLYYSGENEPEDFKYKFDKDIDSYFRDDSKLVISPSFKSKEAYYDYEQSSKDLFNEIKAVRKPKNVNKLFIEINISDDI